eukprot:CAMPEP_0113323780 /NCGR_PEP_ID=MMETSP0010_2-20120614/16560_1 /TAXON_ID=216773 ORGANISM="Corethron hystrix, Strain 308" /NCGR_SAMPLE_ID=MMETSP0010_2 /ASSEMBLY_ACC=CAM_ASM_000155 /LENGTH=334 /DNA_ID=CAMNT_0000182847 /DNA_START=545 /DNA_END=1549 /DNA_ORIENTATION=+ /assembly_acc=CAM_ASM_000155
MKLFLLMGAVAPAVAFQILPSRRVASTGTALDALSRRDLLEAVPAALVTGGLFGGAPLAFAADKKEEDKKEDTKEVKKESKKEDKKKKTSSKKEDKKEVKKEDKKESSKKESSKKESSKKESSKKESSKKESKKETSKKESSSKKSSSKESSKKTPAAATPAVSYQGVYSDPKHPRGYRILTGDASKGTMRLRDEPAGELYTIPLKIRTDRKTGATSLLIDFRVKGGPKDAAGTLGSDGRTLTFPDGNVWKKQEGPAGVWRDGFDSKNLRLIRKEGKGKLTVELLNGSKTVIVEAKEGGKKVTFDFPNKKGDTGVWDQQKNTLSFKDGNVWTKL